MKIAVIGGGPGGLYFSLLMKKADPAHDITVYERNRPDDTFGFGVVFSDETLGKWNGRLPPLMLADVRVEVDPRGPTASKCQVVKSELFTGKPEGPR